VTNLLLKVTREFKTQLSIYNAAFGILERRGWRDGYWLPPSPILRHRLI
jgi:hypothetical protein